MTGSYKYNANGQMMRAISDGNAMTKREYGWLKKHRKVSSTSRSFLVSKAYSDMKKMSANSTGSFFSFCSLFLHHRFCVVQLIIIITET